MPWPNRIRDGRYTFASRSHQLALTEPDRGNAVHGLARWAIWSPLERSDDAVTLGFRLRPQPGWEGSLDLSVTYALTSAGLVVTPRARNVGTDAAPFGVGAHPYVTVGEDRVDEVVLGIPAASLLEMDDRLLPTGLAPVDGTAFDFRDPRPLGELALDTTFADVGADADGRWRVTITHPHTGREVTVWADATAYRWLQVFTGDSLPPATRRTSGIAVEPMTCSSSSRVRSSRHRGGSRLAELRRRSPDPVGLRRNPALDGEGDEGQHGTAKDQHDYELHVEAGTEHHPRHDRTGDGRQLEGAGHDRVVAPTQKPRRAFRPR